ncbi:hypothetical protein E4T48_02386 [Aureobasidium sp. EXF-10727]|nr:hypothetical protein E4T48_02386 [Aureobasidium sp. EXF-10727]
MAPYFRYNLTISGPTTMFLTPYSSPRDRHSTEHKGPKSPRLRLTPLEHLNLCTRIATLRTQISKRNDKIENYRSLHEEHIASIQTNITPYIRRQIEHAEAGRGVRRGSHYQMHLMMNLRIRVQFLRDMIDQWMAENASDEAKIEQLKKELGTEDDDSKDGEDDD